MRVVDNFLSRPIFENLQAYCKNCEFFEQKAGEKVFSVLPVPEAVMPFFELDGYEVIFGFIRRSFKGFDNDYRIHSDRIVQGEKTDMASVFYINEPEGVTRNGTAFWEHEVHGKRLPEGFSDEEFDRLITEDSNDLSKFKKLDFVPSKPNRLLVYDASLFHSKYPNEIEEGERIVLVTFYKLKNK